MSAVGEACRRGRGGWRKRPLCVAAAVCAGRVRPRRQVPAAAGRLSSSSSVRRAALAQLRALEGKGAGGLRAWAAARVGARRLGHLAGPGGRPGARTPPGPASALSRRALCAAAEPEPAPLDAAVPARPRRPASRRRRRPRAGRRPTATVRRHSSPKDSRTSCTIAALASRDRSSASSSSDSSKRCRAFRPGAHASAARLVEAGDHAGDEHHDDGVDAERHPVLSALHGKRAVGGDEDEVVDEEPGDARSPGRRRTPRSPPRRRPARPGRAPAVAMLRCARSGSIAAPSPTEAKTPTAEPTSRRFMHGSFVLDEQARSQWPGVV